MKVAVGFKGLGLPTSCLEGQLEEIKVEVDVECTDEAILILIETEKTRIKKYKRKTKSTLNANQTPMHSGLKAEGCHDKFK